MPEATKVTTSYDWFSLRGKQPFEIFGHTLEPFVWYVVLGVVLGIALIYVGWMYVKDSRAVGRYWATLLGLMRTLVYVILAAVFLLPVLVTKIERLPPPKVSRSKVIVLFDVSDSMTFLRDDVPPEGKSFAEMDTRQEKIFKSVVIRGDGNFQFLKDLAAKNPTLVYRFAQGLDEDFRYLTGDRYWPRTTWEDLATIQAEAERKAAKGDVPAEEKKALQNILDGLTHQENDWQDFLMPQQAASPNPDWVDDNLQLGEKARRELVRRNRDLLATGFTRGTSVEQVLASTLRREKGNLVEGIIVVSDGKSIGQNETPITRQNRDFLAKQVRELSHNQKVPIFVIGVGEHRRTFSTNIADIRAPAQIQPEDKFPVETVIEGPGRDGDGLNKFPFVLEITRVKQVTNDKGEDTYVPIDIILDPLDENGEVIDPKKLPKDEVVPVVNLGKLIEIPPTFREIDQTGELRAIFHERTNTGPKPIEDLATFRKANPPSAHVGTEMSVRILAQKIVNEADPITQKDAFEKKADELAIAANREADADKKSKLEQDAKHYRALANDVGSIARSLERRALEAEEEAKKAKKKEEKDKRTARALDLRAQAADVLAKAKEAAKAYKTGQKYGIRSDTESELRFRFRVPRAKGEMTLVKEHVSMPADVRVIKKPVRVLLFAGVASREYRFLRSVFVREMDKKRAEVCIHLQPVPANSQPRPGVVQDVPKERLLKYFPQTRKRDPNAKPDERFNALEDFDVIIAFDPDWRFVAENAEGLPWGTNSDDTTYRAYQQKNLKVLQEIHDWVTKDGGGLIQIGGRMNAVELSSPKNLKNKIMDPIVDLLPVVLDFTKLTNDDREGTVPYELEIEPLSSEWEFMRLEEDPKKSESPQETWRRFFREVEQDNGAKILLPADQNPERGIYRYVPVIKKELGTVDVVARYKDEKNMVRENDKPKNQPYLVLGQNKKGRVTWIGSGEMWRLRTFKEAYHERFWTQLARYTASGSQGATSRSINPVMGRNGEIKKKITFEVQFETKDGDPYPADVLEKDKPTLKVQIPPGKELRKGDFVQVRDKEGKILVGIVDKERYVEDRTEKIKVRLLKTDPNDPNPERVIAVETFNATVFVPDLKFEPQKGDPGKKGWFEVQFEPVVAGRHVLEVKNPSTGETYRHVLFVADPNPELRDTKPARDRLYVLASEADEFLKRKNLATNLKLKTEVEGKLRRPPRDAPPLDEPEDPRAAGSKPDKEKDDPWKPQRLYFTPETADVIPKTLEHKETSEQEKVEEKKEDPLWDRGFTVQMKKYNSYVYYPVFRDASPRDSKSIISYVLVAVVLLLSMEWLIRKLLRLA